MQRLFINHLLSIRAEPILTTNQIHYLRHILRIKVGDEILFFNGNDGEWRAKARIITKKNIIFELMHQERLPEQKPYNILYCFAPLKQARFDYMIQKSVELGATILQPVITDYTQVTRFPFERMCANALEATEQSNSLQIPECRQPLPLVQLLTNWLPSQPLIVCNERYAQHHPLTALPLSHDHTIGLLIGPEGGFSPAEDTLLKNYDFVTSISLGPRILRADTAAIVALTLIQLSQTHRAEPI